MSLMSLPGHSSSLCVCFIGRDSKAFIVLDYLPCGLQYFLAFVIQKRVSFQVVQMLLPNSSSSGALCLHFLLRKCPYWLYSTYYKNYFLFFHGSAQLYCYLYLISSLVMQLFYFFFFFMFCLGGCGFFFSINVEHLPVTSAVQIFFTSFILAFKTYLL